MYIRPMWNPLHHFHTNSFVEYVKSNYIEYRCQVGDNYCPFWIFKLVVIFCHDVFWSRVSADFGSLTLYHDPPPALRLELFENLAKGSGLTDLSQPTVHGRLLFTSE